MLLPQLLNNSASLLKSPAACSAGLVIGRTGKEGGVKGRARMTRGKRDCAGTVADVQSKYINVLKGPRITKRNKTTPTKSRKKCWRIALNVQY